MPLPGISVRQLRAGIIAGVGVFGGKLKCLAGVELVEFELNVHHVILFEGPGQRISIEKHELATGLQVNGHNLGPFFNVG
jgi:hypothetical protein